MSILCVNTLLKVVSHYDLSVLSMSVTSFQKRKRRSVDEIVLWAYPICLVFVLIQRS